MASDTMSQSVTKELYNSSAPSHSKPPATETSTNDIKMNQIKILKSDDHIVRRPFTTNSEKYIRKLDHLVKMYEKMSEKNDRLRYDIVEVKEEVNKLSDIKRHLCCRLSNFNDNSYMDENLKIPDTKNRDANFEKVISEIITNSEPVGPPVSKKRKLQSKKAVAVIKPKENSEESEAREAINRNLNDAKSLMQQQQQEQNELQINRIQEQKKQQQVQENKRILKINPKLLIQSQQINQPLLCTIKNHQQAQFHSQSLLNL